jgi:hypothetical protein
MVILGRQALLGQLALVYLDCNDLAVVVACDLRHSGLPRMWRNQIGQALDSSNRWRCATAAVALALTALGAGAAPATPGDILLVEADEASLRAAPEAAAPVILRLEAGRRLIEFERRGAWIRVGVFGAVGKVGWVRRDRAAGREPESVGLDLPEVMRGPGAARPDPAPLPAPPATAELPAVFRLFLTGSAALKYAGHCNLIGADGRSRRRKIAGLVRTEIEFLATAILCRVHKQDSRGRLRATLRRAGVLIAEAETAAPFNHVLVRSAGPWGVAKGVRGAVLTRRPSVVPGPSDPILPPLTGPIVPPLTGTLIPPLTGTLIPPLTRPTLRPPGGMPPAVRPD